MGIASLTSQHMCVAALAKLVSPIQSLLRSCMPTRMVEQIALFSHQRLVRLPRANGHGYAVQRVRRYGDLHKPVLGGGLCRPTSPCRLKVVRQVEPGIGASLAGRMVISGRMVDVCAELDRMARSQMTGPKSPLL